MDSFEKLALNVLKTAIKDAIKDTSKIKDKALKAEVHIIKQEAIRFLTVPNEDFNFWCLVANIPASKIKSQMEKITSDPSYLNKILKQLEVLET